jgi:hypothetical protein
LENLILNRNHEERGFLHQIGSATGQKGKGLNGNWQQASAEAKGIGRFRAGSRAYRRNSGWQLDEEVLECQRATLLGIYFRS